MPMTTTSQQFVSIPRAAKLLGRSPRSIRRMIDRGQLVAIDIEGCHCRVMADSIEAYLPPTAKLTAAVAGIVRLIAPMTSAGVPGAKSKAQADDVPAKPRAGEKPAVRGRPFQPGVSGNPKGRPPGAGRKQGPGEKLSVGRDRNG